MLNIGMTELLCFAIIALLILGPEKFQEGLKIEIKDDGKGFDTKNVDVGNGLLNMKKRMEEIGGNFSINSEIGKGTSVNVELLKF